MNPAPDSPFNYLSLHTLTIPSFPTGIFLLGLSNKSITVCNDFIKCFASLPKSIQAVNFPAEKNKFIRMKMSCVAVHPHVYNGNCTFSFTTEIKHTCNNLQHSLLMIYNIKIKLNIKLYCHGYSILQSF